MSDEEIKALTFAELLGDPADWGCNVIVDAEGGIHRLRCCPQCGAACSNPYQHKAWHIRNEL